MIALAPHEIPGLYAQYGSLKEIARKTGVPRERVRRNYNKAVEQGLMDHVALGGKPHTHTKHFIVAEERVKALKPKKARHQTYILTSAQNNTRVHQDAWKNLKALADHYGAQIFVSTFLYANRTAWQKNLDKKKGERGLSELWYDPAILPYVNNERVEIAPGLVWCGEMNISPTAEKPLRGLEVYSGRASAIIPHVKLALDSIATVGGSGTKFNYTTGTVTLRNYIQRKAGLKAEFHHAYGALLVETDEDGHWWVRQLNADSEGTIHDLDLKVEHGKITSGNRVEAITFGDVHVAEIDPVVRDATWGEGGMVDALKPRFQFIHDVLDFRARDYHRKDDPYIMFKRHVEGRESVGDEVKEVASFLRWIKRKDSQTVIVNSNHDRFLGGWLAKNDGRRDPVNAEFWSELNAYAVRYIRANKSDPDYLKLALGFLDPKLETEANAHFLALDDSFVICPKNGGGIECGMHGDLGPNGARGAISQFAKMGRKSNIGHSHTAGIDNGAYQAGTNSKMRLEYNHGPSGWSHSDIITHENGKRQIVTFFNGKWRA